MEPERRCGQCGKAIPWGQVECPFCAERGTFFWSFRRETFLLATLATLLLLFVATGFVARLYHAQEQSLAASWHRRGEAELRAGRANAAIEDFRNALVYARDNTQYRLQLAEALAAAGRVEEARNHLLNLREAEPGNGTVNLELARLAKRQGLVPEALRYFHHAIYGEWDDDPIAHRRQARLELSEFLLRSGMKAEAQAELIALANDLPPDPALHAQVGALLLRAGEYDHAAVLFKQALRLQPNLAEALEGAGETYFEMADYHNAQHYLERAVREDPNAPRASSLLETTEGVLGIDPFQRRLSSQERARRTVRAMKQAVARLESCAASRGIPLAGTSAPTPLQQLWARAQEVQPQVRERVLAREPDRIAPTMDLVFEIERAAEQECGTPQGLDQALLLLARGQGGTRP